MALRGTLTHRKTRRLADELGLSWACAMGLLEALWHVAGEQKVPDGGIGRMSNEDIASEMFCGIDGDKLIAALVKSRWLDENENCRLYVHDWHEHSDDATDLKLARAIKRYANGALPRMTRLSRAERDKLCALFATESHEMPLPDPGPEPEPEIETQNAQARTEPDPWERDSGFAKEVLNADAEWGMHLARKYMQVRDSECIHADRTFLAKQPDPGECVNLAIRSGWKVLKPVFGPPVKAAEKAKDKARTRPENGVDYAIRSVKSAKPRGVGEAETYVMTKYTIKNGKETDEVFDEIGWYRDRRLTPPPDVVRAQNDAFGKEAEETISAGAGR